MPIWFFFQREPYEVKYQFLFELKYCKKDSSKKIINELTQEGRKQLQKYCESEEIANKIANKNCPLKPYLIIFSGCKLSLCESFSPAKNPAV